MSDDDDDVIIIIRRAARLTMDAIVRVCRRLWRTVTGA